MLDKIINNLLRFCFRHRKIEQAHKLYDNSRNLISELRWQRTYFCRGTNIITKEEKLFNIWIFDECLKRLEERKVGKWIKKYQYGNDYCSECNYENCGYGYPKFCPNCGAEMKGESNND